MSFRLRLTVFASLAVAVAVVGTSVAVYYADRAALIGQLDGDLSATRALPPFNAILVGGASRSVKIGAAGGPDVVSPVATRWTEIVLPRSLTAVEVNVGITRPRPPAQLKLPRFTSQTIAGVRSRVLTLFAAGKIVRISGSLVEVDRNLAHLRWLLAFICLGGIGAAAILGAVVSGRAVAPLRRLTATTDRILETGDLSQRIGRRGRDEISRLSARLDELLATLENSLAVQRQLVADASHELRTPIATLRANFELLNAPGALGAREREELAADVGDELEAMTALVSELVELARGEERDIEPREFRLDEVVRTAVDRVARRAPHLAFRTRLEPSIVTGVPERIERAVSNLLDNARKWSPADAAVDVAVAGGTVEVRDRGPGIASEDLPLIFNRFYRSAKARGMPGAGLGLAIVKQIADAHGGSVSAEDAPGGGAILRLRLSPAGERRPRLA